MATLSDRYISVFANLESLFLSLQSVKLGTSNMAQRFTWQV